MYRFRILQIFVLRWFVRGDGALNVKLPASF